MKLRQALKIAKTAGTRGYLWYGCKKTERRASSRIKKAIRTSRKHWASQDLPGYGRFRTMELRSKIGVSFYSTFPIGK